MGLTPDDRVDGWLFLLQVQRKLSAYVTWSSG